MIERYTLPAMGKVWSEENKLQKWLLVEIAACEGQASIGRIPAAAVEVIKDKASFDIARVREIEAETRHDVIAFLTNVGEYVGEESKYIHLGMTSSDMLDTGLALQMKEACSLLRDRLAELQTAVKKQALAHKYDLQMGRTHGIHAEPVTFGLKMALWYDIINRDLVRLDQAEAIISYGQVSGAVGTFANIDPAVEEYVCTKLGLTPCPVSTQIIQRDRHAQFLLTLAVIGSSLEQMATEVRNLQRTDILEVEEPFHAGQKGSSAMPHKRNPMMSERVAGLSRVLRGNALAAMEEVALWHERDLTHSSVERIIIPDSCILLDYMLDKFTRVVNGLVVYPENMISNVEKTLGLIFSQRVLLQLVEKGMLREAAYKIVQQNAMEAWRTHQPFKELLAGDPEVTRLISGDDLDAIFDYSYHTKNVDYIFRRVGLE
ncbi:MAG: adenylosuccinate lyase [Methylocystaceae bacterium]